MYEKCYIMWNEAEKNYFFYRSFNEFVRYSGLMDRPIPDANKVYRVDMTKLEIIEL